MSQTPASGCSSVHQQVMEQVTQMRTMLSSFLGPKQETICTAFCNYLTLEVEGLEEKDFQTFIKGAVKFLCSSNHSNRHFHETKVQLQHLWHRHFNSRSSQHQHQLQGNTSQPFQRHRCLQARSSNPLSRAKL